MSTVNERLVDAASTLAKNWRDKGDGTEPVVLVMAVSPNGLRMWSIRGETSSVTLAQLGEELIDFGEALLMRANEPTPSDIEQMFGDIRAPTN